RGIATALSTRASAVTKPTDPRAVDLYLRARAELRRFWGNHAQTAAGLLEQAVEYAPTSPPILGAYAYAAVQAWVMRGEPDLLPRAEQALERGLASGHGEAFLASAQYRFNRGEPERAAADLARALVRTPMSAQTHELAGKILVEIDGPGAARQHYETARGLDPGRSQIIDTDLARVDALEHKWADADRRVAGLLADADPAIAQLGFVTKARLTTWRGSRDVLVELARSFMNRVSENSSAVFQVLVGLERDGSLDRAALGRAIEAPMLPGHPSRQVLIRGQILCEVALAFDHTDLALTALEQLSQAGFMDITWLDNCPLMASIVNRSAFIRLRTEIGDRAGRVLAAFRAVTAHG
ncbi:MAG TPA: hypothetical protein VFS15_13895, partial [Kofleriaceae bacterium]|nr:hypothetical protein [Kofleriaceae bacterium]